MMTLILYYGFNPHPGLVVASLNKTIFDDYLCLVALNKQKIQWAKICACRFKECVYR